MLIREITLRNLLSFGPDTPPFELRPLNVLIGPNGSGKSNFIEAIGLLQAAPSDLLAPISEGGGAEEWIWKGSSPSATSSITLEINEPASPRHYSIWHHLELTDVGRFLPGPDRGSGETWVSDEWVEVSKLDEGQRERIYNNEGRKWPAESGDPEHLLALRFDKEQSVLAQLAIVGQLLPAQSPAVGAPVPLLSLANYYKHIRIYREWYFGRRSPVRRPQRADLKGDSLSEDLLNLGLVLNRLKRNPAVKGRILELLGNLYAGITDFELDVLGGMVQLYFEEGPFPIPATRLSDGTLRYLCLLAILCHPEPPPLVCIEEPELGLHPDALLSIAKLIEEASGRTQVVITTHSQFLVDCFTHDPEAIVVCEKGERGTTMKRLDSKELGVWLAEYSLGDLWSRGQIGGNRW